MPPPRVGRARRFEVHLGVGVSHADRAFRRVLPALDRLQIVARADANLFPVLLSPAPPLWRLGQRMPYVLGFNGAGAWREPGRGRSEQAHPYEEDPNHPYETNA